MKLALSRPRSETFLVAAVIAGLTLLGKIVLLPIFSFYGFGLLLIAFLILAAGVLLDNL